MTGETVLRRLSAILAADVAGYSRLIAADEVGTLSRFRKIRAEVVDPAIARFGGVLVGTAGDSLLVEFTNALAAVECAIACQNDLARLNDPDPGDRRILFRMGVNLGDVIAADGTIHGDGVNVAARIEKLSAPGGICVSKSVHDLVEGKLGIPFTDLGDHEVKNIAKPVRVYRVETGIGIMAPVSVQGAQAEMVSIAILPFDNMSGDPDQLYFSDGISEDIITELSRFRDLLVISRNSSFQFRGKANDVREIARKLGVQFVVEGSVRKAGNRVRITAQLIDATSTAHVWAERYDRDMTDVFEIQDEITRAVVPFVARHARSTVASRARSRPTESLSAYDCFLQARELFVSDLTAMQAEPLLLRAIEADPNFANAHALISMLHTIRYMNYGDARYLDEALASARRALDLDPDESRANHALGLVLTFLHRMDEAGHYLKRAIALNPNEVYPRADYANWMNYVGMTDDALREIEEVFRRDPYTADWFWDIRGSIEVSAGRYQEALGSYRRMKAVTPSGQCYQAICHVELGQIAEARDCLKRARLEMSGMTLESFIESRHHANPVRARQLLDALRRAEPERPPE